MKICEERICQRWSKFRYMHRMRIRKFAIQSPNPRPKVSIHVCSTRLVFKLYLAYSPRIRNFFVKKKEKACAPQLHHVGPGQVPCEGCRSAGGLAPLIICYACLLSFSHYARVARIKKTTLLAALCFDTGGYIAQDRVRAFQFPISTVLLNSPSYNSYGPIVFVYAD
jgi:hypothetical protein